MKTPAIGVVVGLVVATVSVVALLSRVHRDEIVVHGGEILWDDFGFRVDGVRTARELGPDAELVRARGTFVIVALRVTNHSQGAAYDMSKHTAVLHDSAENHYLADAWAQSALEKSRSSLARMPARLSAGESYVGEIVYDVPLDARGLFLKISWGDALVDTVDALVFGDRRLELDTSAAR